jgi:hypothetical protein
MLTQILALVFSLSLFYIIIHSFNIDIPHISDHYKNYSYKAYLRDFIHGLIALLLAILIFDVLKLKNIILLIGLVALISMILGLSFFSLLKTIKNNDFVHSLLKAGGELGHKLILNDLLIVMTSFFVAMLFNLGGIHISTILTLASTGYALVVLR